MVLAKSIQNLTHPPLLPCLDVVLGPLLIKIRLSTHFNLVFEDCERLLTETVPNFLNYKACFAFQL